MNLAAYLEVRPAKVLDIGKMTGETTWCLLIGVRSG